jgi:Protein of unknown function (DUF3592)
MSTSNSPSTHPSRRLEFVFAGVLFLVAAVFFGYGGLNSYIQQLNAHRGFIPISATVVESVVRSKGSSATTHGESFYPHVVYRYAIGGEEFQSARYFFTGEGWRDREAAESVIARFPIGASVTAYVDGADPSRAVLNNGKPSWTMLGFLLPLFVLAFGAIIYGIRPRHSPENRAKQGHRPR